MKTLMFLATHFIDENVISEYRKMKNTPGVDAVLAIDNTNPKIEFQSRVEDKIFFDTSCKCFFFDSKLHEEMQLPYITFNGEKDFGGVMWHNGDYRFYYLRKNFPDYEFYWMMDYDLFCNAPTYEGFLDKFKNNYSDLLVKSFRISQKDSDWMWTHGLNWIYKDVEIYGSFYPVIRLSARAIDFLYKRRLEHKEIFKNSADKDKRWIHCEVFTPTELMNGGFSCENLEEKNVALKNFYLNDERFFLQTDNHLYHPVKSVKAEISKMQTRYDEIFLLYRKVFFTSLVEKLNLISDVKNFPMQFDKEFNYVILAIPNWGGVRILPFATRQDLCREKFLSIWFSTAIMRKILRL